MAPNKKASARGGGGPKWCRIPSGEAKRRLMVFSRALNVALSQKVPAKCRAFSHAVFAVAVGQLGFFQLSLVCKLHPPRGGINHCSAAPPGRPSGAREQGIAAPSCGIRSNAPAIPFARARKHPMTAAYRPYTSGQRCTPNVIILAATICSSSTVMGAPFIEPSSGHLPVVVFLRNCF
jgi:hypothetical protein